MNLGIDDLLAAADDEAMLGDLLIRQLEAVRTRSPAMYPSNLRRRREGLVETLVVMTDARLDTGTASAVHMALVGDPRVNQRAIDVQRFALV